MGICSIKNTSRKMAYPLNIVVFAPVSPSTFNVIIVAIVIIYTAMNKNGLNDMNVDK